jgi:hypothetical protein
LLRTSHRAIHCAQHPLAEHGVIFRYLLTSQDLQVAQRSVGKGGGSNGKDGGSNGKISDTASRAPGNALREENVTFRDLLVISPFPPSLSLAIRHNDFAAAAAPRGAQCLLKILSWLHYAQQSLHHVPFVAYADLDTFWALGRVDGHYLSSPLSDHVHGGPRVLYTMMRVVSCRY